MPKYYVQYNRGRLNEVGGVSYSNGSVFVDMESEIGDKEGLDLLRKKAEEELNLTGFIKITNVSRM
jgi:hypothetical protein